MTVAIPARDEAASLPELMAALAVQPDLSSFDVVVFANNCSDATVAVTVAAAREHPNLQVTVVEANLAAGDAHVGMARKLVMDFAARRYDVAGMSRGIVATTDADTVPARDWTAAMLQEMRDVDAVAGFVELHPAQRLTMPLDVRRLYAAEMAYRRVWTDLESRIDPEPENAAPRHGNFVCANLAVTAESYVAAGGMPPVACLEDRAFLNALRRIDARIRFSLRARAWTSPRRSGRVTGGFAAFMNHLYDAVERGAPLYVRNPDEIIDELRGRALLRRWWQTGSDDSLSSACDLLEITPSECRAGIDRALPFGTVHERVVALAQNTTGRVYEILPVDEAIAVLERAAASLNALTPTRNSAASGAG